MSRSNSCSYSEEEERAYGCRYYKRKCALLCPCCNEVWCCRLCHDEKKDAFSQGKHAHKLDRKKVKRIQCLLCKHEQNVTNTCEKCGVQFGKYYCEICRLFDDDDTKGQFHCDKCGICRVGGRDNFYHCDKCGCCISVALRDDHQCVERSLDQNCPVCLEDLFTSTKQVTFLPCGHPLHKSCYLKMNNQLTRSASIDMVLRANTCPLCSKSVRDMSFLWEAMDREIEATPMPEEYRDTKVHILCNDCGEKTEVAFHVIAQKCSSCGSYNTKRT